MGNMSFRLSPYKITRLILIIAVLSYGYVEIIEFRKNKIKNTEEVTKSLEIRKKDFINSDEVKRKLIEEKETEISADPTSSEVIAGDGVTGKDSGSPDTGSSNKPQDTGITDVLTEADKKTENQKKEEEEQKKIASQIAQQKKEAAAKKAREAEIAAKEKAQKEAAARKAREKAAAESKKKDTEKTSAGKMAKKKYIQVATLNSEAAAKSAVSKLGGNFNYQKISGKKTLYVIVSISTDNPSTLASLENQVKSKLGRTKYIIRTVGK